MLSLLNRRKADMGQTVYYPRRSAVFSTSPLTVPSCSLYLEKLSGSLSLTIVLCQKCILCGLHTICRHKIPPCIIPELPARTFTKSPQSERALTIHGTIDGADRGPISGRSDTVGICARMTAMKRPVALTCCRFHGAQSTENRSVVGSIC